MLRRQPRRHLVMRTQQLPPFTITMSLPLPAKHFWSRSPDKLYRCWPYRSQSGGTLNRQRMAIERHGHHRIVGKRRHCMARRLQSKRD
jgi:hypothetical protein